MEDSSSLTLNILPSADRKGEKLFYVGSQKIEPGLVKRDLSLPDVHSNLSSGEHHVAEESVKVDGGQNEDQNEVQSKADSEEEARLTIGISEPCDHDETVDSPTHVPDSSEQSPSAVQNDDTVEVQPHPEQSDEDLPSVESLFVTGSPRALPESVATSPNAVKDKYGCRSPQANDDEDELCNVEESIEEPTKKLRDRKLSRSSFRSADFLGTCASDRSSPVTTHVRNFASSPPTRSNSIHRPHPQAMNPLPLFPSSPHKYESDSRQKRRDNRHDHSPSRHMTSLPMGMKTSFPHIGSSKLPIFNEYQNTIDKADQFQLAIAALAESGSSDQDSDSEPRSRMATSSLHPHEAAMVSEKMRAPPAVMKEQLLIRKELGEVSFGFSIADGQYDKGVYVKSVKPGGPSDRGGLLQYDRIIKVSNVYSVESELLHTYHQ